MREWITLLVAVLLQQWRAGDATPCDRPVDAADLLRWYLLSDDLWRALAC